MRVATTVVLYFLSVAGSVAPAEAVQPLPNLRDQVIGRVLLQLQDVEFENAGTTESDARLRVFQYYDYDSSDIQCDSERCAARRLLFLFWRRGEVPETAIEVSPGAFEWRHIVLKSLDFERGKATASIEAERKDADNQWSVQTMNFAVQLD